MSYKSQLTRIQLNLFDLKNANITSSKISRNSSKVLKRTLAINFPAILTIYNNTAFVPTHNDMRWYQSGSRKG